MGLAVATTALHFFFAIRALSKTGNFLPVDLQLLAVLGEGEHQPFGTGALHVPCLDSWCAHDERKGLPAGLPLDRRAGDLDVHDGPFLLRLAPQSKGDRTPAKHFLPSLSREHILELDITKNGLRLGHEIKDHLVTFAASLNDNLLEFIGGRDVFGMLRLGNDKRNLPFFPNFRDRGPGRFQRSRFFLDEDGLAFIGDATRRFTCGGANQRSKDDENLNYSACGKRIHGI